MHTRLLFATVVLLLLPGKILAQYQADFTAGSTSVCSGSSIIFTDNSIGATGVTLYGWIFGPGASPATASGTGPFTVTYTGSGPVTVSLNLDDPVLGVSSVVKTDYITINPLPVVSIASAGPFCTGSPSVQLTGSPSGGTFTGTGVTAAGVFSPSVSGAGTFNIVYTYTDINGCTNRTNINIDVNSTPSAPLVSVTDNCNGTSTLSTAASGSLLWSTGASTSSVIVSSMGLYTVTTTVNGCTSLPGSGTASPRTTPPTPVVTVVDNCDGTSVLSTAATGTLLWNTGASTASITVSSAGIYTVTSTINGCPSLQGSGTAAPKTTPAAPAIGVITQPSCTVATGSVVLNGLPATGTWTLTRSPGGTLTTGSGTSTTITGLAPGNYTFTVTNAGSCISASSAGAVINTQPATPTAPVTGTISQPSCSVSTGSVAISGLPSTGSWTLTQSPGGVTTTGTGASVNISGLATGTYTFTVTNASGCTSAASSPVVISAQPLIPSAPAVGLITQPTCILATGGVVLNGLPSTGTWTLTMYPGAITSVGTGVSTTLTGLVAGTYNFTVANAAGCTSGVSASVVINTQPVTPSAPVPGVIVQPSCILSTGSVPLSGLPSTGTWTLTRSPGGIITTGTGTSTTISGLATGTYTFIVTNAAGCTSVSSGNIIINTQPVTPAVPVVNAITQPTCILATGSVALSGLPASGTWTLTQYPGATTTTGTGTTATVTGLAAGTYNFTVTNASGCVSIVSSNAVISAQPASPSAPVPGTITQPTCTVATGSVPLSGLPSTGTWTLTRSPGAIITTGTGTSSTISGLATGTYTYTVTNVAGCTSVPSGSIVINTQPAMPTAPVVGSIIQPTCVLATGSVALSGLPSTGTWTLTQTPGGTTAGSGVSSNVSGLAAGTYSFTVTTNPGCISAASSAVIISTQPATSPAPVTGTITQPSCSVATGSVVLNGLPPSGTWILTRSPGASTITGSGVTATDAGLAQGTYTYTVTNTAGCISASSANVVINAQPASPATPLQTTDCSAGVGKAAVTVITPVGAGLTYQIDGGTFQPSPTFTKLANGSHIITVKNSAGCTTAGTSFSITCGCVNGPNLVFASTSGNTCGTSPVTIDGNIFDGSATIVTLTQNGSGILSPASVTSSPFSFTYTPAAADADKNVVITATTDNPNGTPCAAAVATYTLKVNSVPAAPVPGNVSQPTCTLSTGSVDLAGLPATGTWTILRTPGGVITTGSGTTKTISGIDSGTYTFTVTNSNGCTSLQSAAVVINAQPALPAAPVPGVITQPSCAVPTGSVVINGLPDTGTWNLIRFPGTIVISGTGISTTIPGLAAGTYNFTVTSASGCTSTASANVVIITQPATPSAPVTGTITQPTCNEPTGKVVLSALPTTGTWTLTRLPDGTLVTGTGTSTTVSGLPVGNYNFTVTNSAGCVSALSGSVGIVSNPSTPKVTVTDPSPVCFPATVDLTAASITNGSLAGLTFTYWKNTTATQAYTTPTTATGGTYYIKGTVTATGCSDIKPVTVVVRQNPVANAGPDKILDYLFQTKLEALSPGINETGSWSVLSGSGVFSDISDPTATVSNLQLGNNIFLWTLINGVCLPSSDSVTITIRDLVIPTLITPNMDGKNDYFVIRGKETLGKIELVVFDRRGFKVYENRDYNNDWNGVDQKGNPLPDDTYFFVMRTSNGKSFSKYIVIRR